MSEGSWPRPVDTDVYVWDGGVAGDPGSVVAMVTGSVFQKIPTWPEVGRYDVEVSSTVSGAFTIGAWGNWPGEMNAYFWLSDEDGPQGHPWTYVAEGTGFPEGWQNPRRMFGGSVHSLGFGVHFSPSPTPVRGFSWGRVKQLYSR